MELVVQRDGKPSGRALFHIDVATQRAVEFTKSQRKEYDKLYGDNLEKTLDKSKSNPDADAKKAAKLVNGDI